jgi:NAD(P)H-hydrate epimerase
VGYRLDGAPRDRVAELIRWANAGPAPILALDVPSGMDAGTGESLEPVMEAAATLTLALPKVGLMPIGGRAPVGELYLADIGVPPALWAGAEIGVDVGPLFAKSEIIRLK